MITPKELLLKAEKSFLKIVTSTFRGDNIFPWIIPSNKQVLGNNYSDWKNDLIPLYQHSKSQKGKGYSVDWKEKKINGSKQSVPAKIYFETFEDFLFFIHREKDYQNIVTAKDFIVSHFPSIEIWTYENPELLLDNVGIWTDLIKVCDYFVNNPPPHNYYIRELPIEVHSKFIEQNTVVLRKILDQILPASWINMAESEFALRYFLKKVNVYAQIKILDDELKPFLGYDECSLTLEDAAWLKWLPRKVFIIENQACYLSFPKMKNAVAIFGEGFKSRISKHIPWLGKTQLFCWFDLDAAGFEMLNSIRHHYPEAKSFLMDQTTYDQHSNFSVENKYRKKELPFLLPEERQVYDYLQKNNKRLEQERIPQGYVKHQIEKF